MCPNEFYTYILDHWADCNWPGHSAVKQCAYATAKTTCLAVCLRKMCSNMYETLSLN